MIIRMIAKQVSNRLNQESAMKNWIQKQQLPSFFGIAYANIKETASPDLIRR
jgi:hypothetical protein